MPEAEEVSAIAIMTTILYSSGKFHTSGNSPQAQQHECYDAAYNIFKMVEREQSKKRASQEESTGRFPYIKY